MNQITTLDLKNKPEPGCIKINNPQPHKLKICLKNEWFICFSEENGIEFNREAFPKWKPDDFCLEFVNVMEKSFNIKFIKKEIHE